MCIRDSATTALQSLTVEDTTGTLTVGGADTANQNGTEDLGPVTLVRSVGTIDFGAGVGDGDDDDVITGGIVLNGGGDNNNDSVGAGNNDSLLELRTTGGGDVRVNGPVTLNSDVLITTNGDGGLDTGQATAGNITFSHDARVNSQAAENNDLELRSGTGTVNINANLGDDTLGTTRALQSLSLIHI